MLLIHTDALGLHVWAGGTTSFRALIVVEPGPMKNINEVINRTLDKPGSVRVFNAEKEFAVVLPGKEIIVEGSAEATDMQVAGRTRREPNSYRGQVQLIGL